MGNGAAKFKVSFIKAYMENSCMKLMNVQGKMGKVKMKKMSFFLQLQYGKTETRKMCPTEKSGPVIERCVSDVVVAIPAREVSNPILSGYLDRKLRDDTWKWWE